MIRLRFVIVITSDVFEPGSAQVVVVVRVQAKALPSKSGLNMSVHTALGERRSRALSAQRYPILESLSAPVELLQMFRARDLDHHEC